VALEDAAGHGLARGRQDLDADHEIGVQRPDDDDRSPRHRHTVPVRRCPCQDAIHWIEVGRSMRYI
jgi:hypothetical protein